MRPQPEEGVAETHSLCEQQAGVPGGRTLSGVRGAGSAKTLAWLKAWKTTGQPWPWFIKRSPRTICELDGTPRPKKRELPIPADLL